MTKPKAPNTIRMELTELKADIRSAVDAITSYKEDRSATNADIAAIVTRLESKGIHRKALAWAMTYSEWDPDTRAGFDAAYALVREAIGSPFDGQLFDKDGAPNIKPKPAKEPANGEAIAAAVLADRDENRDPDEAPHEAEAEAAGQPMH